MSEGGQLCVVDGGCLRVMLVFDCDVNADGSAVPLSFVKELIRHTKRLLGIILVYNYQRVSVLSC